MRELSESHCPVDVLVLTFRDGLATMRSVLETIPESVLVLSSDLNIVALNSCASELFGYGGDELIGKQIGVLMPSGAGNAGFIRRIRQMLTSCLENTQCIDNVCVRHRRGGELFVDVRLGVINGGPQRLLIATLRDSSRRRLVERRLKRSKQSFEDRVSRRTAELRSANERLQLYCAAVSHELRTPLQVITGYGCLMLRDSDQGKALSTAYLQTIVQTAERMSEIITDLLKLGQCQNGVLSLTEVDMAQLVRQVFDRQSDVLLGRRAQLIVEALPKACADLGLIAQVFTNLLSNALKFSRERGVAVVRVRGWCDANECIYEVSDNGIGFRDDVANKLFHAFQRLHASRAYEGTGVGLAISRSIVERHGGRIWAESNPGKGARFCFSLPQSDGKLTAL